MLVNCFTARNILVPRNSQEVVWQCYNSPANPLVGWGGDEIWSVDSQENR